MKNYTHAIVRTNTGDVLGLGCDEPSAREAARQAAGTPAPTPAEFHLFRARPGYRLALDANGETTEVAHA